MKFTLTLLSLLLLTVVNNDTHARVDPALGDVIICYHVHANNVREQFAVIQATQSCPPYVEQFVKDGIVRTQTTTMEGSVVSPPMTDQSSPTCWNEEVLLPTD